MIESENYLEKKAFFDRVLTVYGRNAVLEALQDNSLTCYCIHLATSNREAGSVAKITQLAEKREISIKHHSRVELARISKNGKQDQGVALDIICPGFNTLDNFLNELPGNRPVRLLALDGITNPQNLGMIVRSAAAGHIDGILWSPRGNAALGPLVIKASAGTLYRAPMLVCSDLVTGLTACRDAGMDICTLEATAKESLFGRGESAQSVFVLGNESEGVSDSVKRIATTSLSIPMNNAVESLNVAVTASLIAYAGNLGR
ncbi:MAG: 23S rRNA (guanosine2251-2'-O)-methyltransferase [Halioglobus sp.]|jgi:23S rRNA (guanosine2251-2'-O)-methyltransferase